METLLAEGIKQLGVPGSIGLTLLICVFLTTRSGANRSDAVSTLITTNAEMTHDAQTEAFRATNSLLATTIKLGELEVRVTQLEAEGKQKDTVIQALRHELDEVQQTVTILQDRLKEERTEKEVMARSHAKEIDVLTRQIVLLRERMEKLGEDELKELARAVESLTAEDDGKPEPKPENTKEIST